MNGTKQAPTGIDVILPAYNPNQRIIDVVEGLVRTGFSNIIVIDDGSDHAAMRFFDEINTFKQVQIVRHAVNQGKGRALKTGFNHWLNHYPGSNAVVTLDSDGQHAVDDVVKCCEVHRQEHPDELLVGCRDFSTTDVPFRSRFGNKLTRIMMSLFCGITITDTQSGLRCIPRELVKLLVNSPGERYEFETNMLLLAKAKGFTPAEVAIKTIYFDQNSGSHFNPLRDSLKIYAIILKYIVSSLSSFLVDISIFTGSIYLLKGRTGEYILLSTVLARLVSSYFNFYVNRNVVFSGSEFRGNTAFRYFLLCIVQMFVSAFLVEYVYGRVPVNESLIKGLVDSVLFVINFVVQREWVFRSRKA